VTLSPTVAAALQGAALHPATVERVVRSALEEDLRWGPDVTTAATIAPGAAATADVVAREAGVVAGIPIALAVMDAAGLPPDCSQVLIPDGGRVRPGDVVATLQAPLAGLLTAERTVLNFLTHLSGVATATARWVEAVAGTGAVVRDTRKTLPGLRELQKYAVRCGGGTNHRMGLGDAALIKDNHVLAAGGITAAVAAVGAAGPGLPLEVECDTVAEVVEALAAGAQLVLLDNMGPDAIREALAAGAGHPQVRWEASGGLRLETAREIAETGVDYLAVGALTHSSPALDLGLDLRVAAVANPAAR
jgi:nicotinate-nucleotide pyrophosphorylase (carboxylating)